MPPPDAPGIETGRTLHAVLVEDNPGDRRLVVEALRPDPEVSLTHASTLAQALERLQQDPVPDVVVLDLGLPDSQGLDTYRQVAQAAPTTPTIVLSGDRDDGRAVAAVAEGAQDFLVKGDMDLQSLPRIIRHAVDRAALVQQLGTNLRHRTGLLEIGQVALEVADPDELARSTVRIVREALDVDAAIVFETDSPDTGRVRACTGIAAPTEGFAGLASGCVASLALAEHGPVRVRDLHTDDRCNDSFLTQQGVVGAMAVAVRGAAGVFGVLGVGTHAPRDFSNQDAEFLAGASRALSSAHSRRAAEVSLQGRLREMAGLAATRQALQDENLVVSQVGELVAGQLGDALQALPDLRIEVTLDGTTWSKGAACDDEPLTSRVALVAEVRAAGRVRGEIRAVHLRGTPFLLPHEQRLLDALADSTGTWLTRREAVDALTDRQRQLDFLVSQLPGTVWTTDTELRFTRSVGRGLATLGLVTDEAVGQTVEELLGSGATTALEAHHRALAGVDSTYVFGQRDEWQAYVEPLRDRHGSVTGVIGIALDLSEQRQAEAARRESDARLRALMDQLPGVVWTVDTDLVITSHTGTIHETVGLAPQSLVGTPGAATMGADSRSLAAAVAALNGTSSVVEEHFLKRWWEMHVTPLRTADGDIVGALGLGLDITAAKEAQQQAHLHRQRLQGLFDNALDAFLLADDEGYYLDANTAAEQLTGRPRADLLGRRARDLAGPASEEGADAAWHAFLADGSAAGEFEVHRPDGSRVLAEFRAVTGIAPGVHLSVLRDVTERRRTELQLRESEERFRRLAENAQDMIFRVRLGRDPGFEYVSPAVQDMLGYTPEQFYNDPELALRLVHPDDRAAFSLQLGVPSERSGLRLRWRHRDGHYLWIDERHTYVRDSAGEIIASEGVARDVSDHVRIEEALRQTLVREQEAADHLRDLDRMKNAFLAGVSHEMRTPLTTIVGLSESMSSLGPRLDETTRTNLAERIGANARRLHRLLTDLLDVERLAQGTTDARRTEVDLGDLVRRVAEDVSLDGRSVTVTGEQLQVAADVPRLERIVEHLVHNAVRHTPRGSHIDISWQRDTEGVLVKVDDDGPGVPDELKESIFAPFQHGDTEAAKVGGTGIGLAMVQRYARVHGGRAWVEDRPGGGASFRVLLADDEPAMHAR